MLSTLRRYLTQRSPHARIRETLFGDMPLKDWAGKASDEPWCFFTQARDALQASDPEAAKRALFNVLACSGLESRHILQAWHALRSLGVAPPPELAKLPLGFVAELHRLRGYDILACYPDFSARHFTLRGGGSVIDVPIPQIETAIKQVFTRGAPALEKCGPWEGTRRGLPDLNIARLTFLTPSGLHFVEGPIASLRQDERASPLLLAALDLLAAIQSLKSQHTQAR